jgi:hypothetical protein
LGFPILELAETDGKIVSVKIAIATINNINELLFKPILLKFMNIPSFSRPSLFL